MIRNTNRYLSIRTKILVGYGAAFAFTGIVVIYALVDLIALGNASDAILRENYRSILAAENMAVALDLYEQGIIHTLAGDLEEGETTQRDAEREFLVWFSRAKDNITIPGEAELVAKIEKGYAAYCQNLPPHDTAAYRAMTHPLLIRVRDDCLSLKKLNEGTMYAASAAAAGIARHSVVSTAVAGITACALVLVLGFTLAGRIMRPIRKFREAARTISDGDYSVKVPVETNDELGALAQDFNRMSERLLWYRELDIDKIVAERNKSEAILASIDDGLVVFAPDLAVTGMNPAARRILRAEIFEDRRRDAAALIHDQRLLRALHEVMETGLPPAAPDELRIINIMDGQTSRQFLFSVTTIRGREETLAGAVLLLRDVTSLREAERMKSEFITAASHELRTPLTSLGMSVELLREHAAALPAKDHELLEAAHEEILRMSALIDDLLELSKIESGRIELSFDAVAVPPLLEKVRDIFQSQAKRHGVSIDTVEPEDEQIPPIRADANKILWVLTNLVSNALRYVKEQGEIVLSAKSMGNNVHLTVRDNGPGIPRDQQARIFQKFVQVKGKPTGGAGLGLAICREIVRAHGGTIWVESEEGSGCRFTFSVPTWGT